MRWILLIVLVCYAGWVRAAHLSEHFIASAERWARAEKANSLMDRTFFTLLDRYNVDRSFLQKILSRVRLRPYSSGGFPLVYVTKPLNLQLISIDVLNPIDDVTGDDLYLYFFITDGTHTVGKVTEIYRGLRAGESVLFKAMDRRLYPLAEVSSRLPQGALIVDYGVVESDGDDIRELKKLTALIIDLAALIYAGQDPALGQYLLRLREEIRALADALLSGQHDDELFTSTWGLSAQHLLDLQRDGYLNIRRKHAREHMLNSWKYRLTLRLHQ